MRRYLFLAVLVFAAAPLAAQGQADHRAVRAAVLDYVDGVYGMKPDLIARSVHPTLVKQGMVRRGGDDPYRGPVAMTYQELYDLAGTWNEGNRNADPATATKLVEVFDVQDATAIAKLTAVWGTDYFLLSKLDGKWMIMQVLWQTTPGKG